LIVSRNTIFVHFIHVNDVVKAFYLSIKKSVRNVVINVGSGRPRSVLDMVNILQGKKIFILGGCGLIGSEISKLLKRLGAKIIILDKSIKIQNKKIKFEYIDLENFSDKRIII
jgi:nucleoside-diphosphate-sugar epimerase